MKVFTARYGLIPYTKHIIFFLEKVKFCADVGDGGVCECDNDYQDDDNDDYRLFSQCADKRQRQL